MSLGRWEKLSEREQIGHIAAELARADSLQGKDKELYRLVLERALELIDLTNLDAKHKENTLPFWVLRSEVAKAYIGASDGVKSILAIL